MMVIISHYLFLFLTMSAEVSISNHSILAQYCKDHNVGLVVVGPEVPLAAGSQSIRLSLLLCPVAKLTVSLSKGVWLTFKNVCLNMYYITG